MLISGRRMRLNCLLRFGKMCTGYNLTLMKVEIRMEKYKLTFGGWDGGSSNFGIKEVAIFHVSTGPVSFPVSIQMVRTLYTMLTTGTPGLSEAELRKAMLVLALPRPEKLQGQGRRGSRSSIERDSQTKMDRREAMRSMIAYEKAFGPKSVAEFEGIDDPEERERIQRDAYERVNALLSGLGISLL
jgi:hypothetical protein